MDAPLELLDNLPPGARVSTFDLGTCGVTYSAIRMVGGDVVTNNNWPGNSVAVIVPVIVVASITLTTAFYQGGNQGVGGANVDLGIYSFDLARLASTGNVAGVNGFATPALTAAVTLTPGRYWIAMVSSNNAATYLASNLNANLHRFGGCQSMAAASPLPATLTLAAPQSFMPLFGFSVSTTV